MRKATVIKIGIATLLSFSAHAALVPILPHEAPDSAQIKGGSVSVHLVSGRKVNADSESAGQARAEAPRRPEKDTSEAKASEAVKPKPVQDTQPDIVPKPKPKPEPEVKPVKTVARPEKIPPPKPEKQPLPSDYDQADASPEHSHTHGKAADDPADKPSETSGESVNAAREAGSGDPAPSGDTHAVITADNAHAQTAGNAAESNFKGLVMQHLSRQRMPRASSPGSAFVSFTLSSSGEIEEIRIADSSGSGRFDRDALKVVEKAAPYPKPPPGVNRVFTVEIKGR